MNKPITHNCLQGSEEWKKLRSKYFTASEASAMMGVSKYQKRGDLIKAKATGITKDVDTGTQRLFDAGHAAEAAARPIVEQKIGQELFPVTMSLDVDGLPLLASLDGISMLGDLIWENKLLNSDLVDSVASGELHFHYAYQMEQQLLVAGAEKCYFTTSDGTPEGTHGMWYSSIPELRTALIAGWKQFAIDVAAYVPEEAKPKAEGVAPETLPALRIEVTGMVTASNLDQFKASALAVFRGINTSLQTDEDFASAEKAVRFCRDAEERLESAKAHALSQTETIDALFKTIDSIKEEARTVRLKLDKMIKAEKENRKADIVREAQAAFDTHYKALADRVGFLFSVATVSFASALSGLKSLDSMRDKVSVALANAKIEANAIADRIDANRKTVEDMSLFPDFSNVCAKLPEDFAALMAMRKQQRADAEKAKAEREAFQKTQMAEHERLVAERDAERKAAEKFRNDSMNAVSASAVSTGLGVASVSCDESGNVQVKHIANDQIIDNCAMINLSEINARLGFTVSANLLEQLGFTAVIDKAAKRYPESSFKAICAGLSAHILNIGSKQFKLAA